VELLRSNQVLSLIHPGTEHHIDILLFYESIVAARFIIKDSAAKSLIHLGAASGFPGIVCALLFPDIQVTLAEEEERKCEFLRSIVSKLDLKNVKVVSNKLESLNIESGTVAVAKDLSNLARTLLLGGKILSKGTKFYILKGTDWFSEVAALPSQICSTWNTEMALEFDLPERKGVRVVIRSSKLS
jgi:16S rRNA (guanine527-N7)-methyltransferase